MNIDWGSFCVGIAAMLFVEFIFFGIYIKLAERRVEKMKKDDWGGNA